MYMGVLDAMIDPCFRDEAAGRVVVFTGGQRMRGYLLKSVAEEPKIRAFLKMFYFAQFAVQLLGLMMASGWSSYLSEGSGRPAEHWLSEVGLFLGIYSVVVVLPLVLLWRSYRKAQFSFVSPQDEVVLSSQRMSQRRLSLVLGLVTLGIVILLGVAWMIRFK
jgi:hypothetical protein